MNGRPDLLRGAGDFWSDSVYPKEIMFAMIVVNMPAIIGIQVRRTTAMGEMPAAPATAMMTPATGLMARSMPEANCIGVTSAATEPPRPAATSGASEAKDE